MTNIEKAAELILLCAQKQILKKAVFSKPEGEDTLRMTATLRIIKGRPALQAERLTRDNKAHHQNISLDGGAAELCSLVSEFRQVNIITTVGDSEYRRSASGKDTLLGGDKLTAAAQKSEGGTVSVGGNDKKKNYILDGSEKFLILLGGYQAGRALSLGGGRRPTLRSQADGRRRRGGELFRYASGQGRGRRAAAQR